MQFLSNCQRFQLLGIDLVLIDVSVSKQAEGTNEAHAATVHEERSVSAQPLRRQVEQVRLGNHSVVQVERPLQTGRK